MNTKVIRSIIRTERSFLEQKILRLNAKGMKRLDDWDHFVNILRNAQRSKALSSPAASGFFLSILFPLSQFPGKCGIPFLDSTE